jgi:hypothetical protein
VVFLCPAVSVSQKVAEPRHAERTLERRSVTLRIGELLLWPESAARWARKYSSSVQIFDCGFGHNSFADLEAKPQLLRVLVGDVNQWPADAEAVSLAIGELLIS